MGEGIAGVVIGGGLKTPGTGGKEGETVEVENAEPGNKRRRGCGGVCELRETSEGEKKLDVAISENVLELS